MDRYFGFILTNCSDYCSNFSIFFIITSPKFSLSKLIDVVIQLESPVILIKHNQGARLGNNFYV